MESVVFKQAGGRGGGKVHSLFAVDRAPSRTFFSPIESFEEFS